MKLTPALVSKLFETPMADLTSLDMSNKEISHIDDISACISLRKLNLAKNAIKSSDALSGLQYLPDLTWLNLSNNSLENFDGLQKLKSLFVLNMSHNQLNRISIHITSLTELKALILNHNRIKTLDNLASLTNLNTLVLSHNSIETIPPLPTLSSLTKLSVAHNSVRLVPDLSANAELKELRLNDNKILRLPESIRQCSALEIVDLGNNHMREWTDVAALGSLLHLVNLNLKGNPVSEKEDYKEKILALIPSLRVLDGERFDTKFLQRRQKQKAHIEFIKDLQSKKQKVQEFREKRRQTKQGEESSEEDDSEAEVKKGPVKTKKLRSDRPSKRPKVNKK